MRDLDPGSLRLFVATADERSLTAAAAREHMALAAVSKRVRDLEARLDTALLYRRPRGVEPTPAGDALLHHARGLLDDMDRLAGTDNFESKFLINDLSLKYKKFLVTGAISKFDGHIFTFNFKNKKEPCLRCFYQEEKISDEILNCEYEGILGTVAGIVGTMQANEILKNILNIGQSLNNYILIIDLLNLNFRKAKIKKRKNCLCN